MISESSNINLTDLDEMVDQVRSVGFNVMEAHTRFYAGGLNFLILRK